MEKLHLIKSPIFPLEEIKINDYDAYKIYNNIRLHFNTKKYNAVKYHFNNKNYTGEQYKKIPMSEVAVYGKLAKEFQYKQNLMIALTAHFYYNRPEYLAQSYPDSDEIKSAYLTLKKFFIDPKKVIEDDLTIIKNNVKIDAFKAINNTIPKIYHLAVKGLISTESLIVLDSIINLTKYTDSKINSMYWDTYKERYEKYKLLICTTIDNDYKQFIKNEFIKYYKENS